MLPSVDLHCLETNVQPPHKALSADWQLTITGTGSNLKSLCVCLCVCDSPAAQYRG